MGLLEPFALLLLPALGAVIALYLLRFRRPVAPIPSVTMWERTLRDREANTLWQRLRVSTLLVVQLLTLLLLIVAVARPWTLGSGERVRENVLVIDVSASMNGRVSEFEPSRMESAKRQALKTVDDMDGDGTATLIVSGDEPTVLVPATSDKARLRSSIRELSARPVRGDMLAALRLAASITDGRVDSAIWVYSDGAFADIGERVSLNGPQLNFVATASDGDNQGITAMAMTAGAGGAPSVFIQVANSSAVTVTRRIDISVDDTHWEARTLELGAGQTRSLEVPNVPGDARVLHAQLSGSDVLGLDDNGWVVTRSNSPISVLLVSEGNRFLEVALSLLPSTSLYRVPPAEYQPSVTLEGRPFDLTIVDAGVPITTLNTLPAGNLLVFRPETSLPGITVSGVITNPVPRPPQVVPTRESETNVFASDTRLDVGGLTSVTIAEAAFLEPGPEMAALLNSDKGPLIVAGEVAGRRIAVVGFALRDSDLPLQAAFPIMVRDLVGLLRPDNSLGLPADIRPGSSVRLVPSETTVTELLVEDPAGTEWTIPADESGALFADTLLPGTYYVTHYATDTVVWQGAFAVNLFSRDESLLPANPAALRSLVAGKIRNTSTAAASGARNEIWPVIAVVALLMLLGEWAYANRIALRRAITEARARRLARGA